MLAIKALPSLIITSLSEAHEVSVNSFKLFLNRIITPPKVRPRKIPVSTHLTIADEPNAVYPSRKVLIKSTQVVWREPMLSKQKHVTRTLQVS